MTVRVVAVDSKGQEAAGEPTPLDVLRPEELERSLSSRRASLKSDLAGIRHEQGQMRESAASIRPVPGESAEATDVERSLLRELQFKQGKVRSDVERAARTLTGIFDAYVYDRLAAEVPGEKVLEILDRVHRASFTQSPRPPAAGPGAPPAGAPNPAVEAEGEAAVFPWSLYLEIAAARRRKEVFDTGILDKMIQVLEEVVVSADSVAPAAYTAATDAATSPGAPDAAPLVVAQDRLIERLDRALAYMADWQNLNELVLALRRLIEEQEAVNVEILKMGHDAPDGPR